MVKYLYIDDDKLSESQDKVSALSTKDSLEIGVEKNLLSWEEEIERLKKGDYDGLILDLKLDELPVKDGKHSEYRGTTLAQHIRNLQKEGSIKPFPMILFTGEANMRLASDPISSDLFDLVIDKGSLSVKRALELQIQLVEIVDCYQHLAKGDDAISMVCPKNHIDERFIDVLHDEQINGSVASCAHFLLHEFILKPGLLIDETLLAARLGVDTHETAKDVWSDIKRLFDESRYAGIFEKGWQRWWMNGVNIIWKGMTGGEYLQQMGADERVAVLKRVLGTEQIRTAQISRYASSNEFWAVCCGTGKPLDPIDGFEVAGQDTAYPWQDLKYVSREAAFLQKNISQWKGVASSEKARLEYQKKEFSGDGK